MTDDLIRLVSENFAGSMRTMARYCGGTSAEEDGIVLYAGASPSAFPWNGVIRTKPGLDADEIVSRARSYFGLLGHEFSVIAMAGVDDDIIESLGSAVAKTPEMVIDAPPAPFDLADGAQIRQVDDEESRIGFLAAVSEAFLTLGEVPETWTQCYPTVESLNNPESVAMVVYEGGRAAAGGMSYRTGDVIEILHIGTHSSFRRRGYGEAVTTALTAHGFEHGATLASLQSAPMGYSTYQRIGYRTITACHLYLNPGEDQ